MFQSLFSHASLPPLSAWWTNFLRVPGNSDQMFPTNFVSSFSSFWKVSNKLKAFNDGHKAMTFKETILQPSVANENKQICWGLLKNMSSMACITQSTFRKHHKALRFDYCCTGSFWRSSSREGVFMMRASWLFLFSTSDVNRLGIMLE